MKYHEKKYLVFAFAAIVFMGCRHLGTQTVEHDRFDYNTVISDSWQQQTLLNIVKLRYADMPLLVEVASVVSSYTLEGSVDLGYIRASKESTRADFFNIGANSRYIDRPTITYAPITGKQFHKSLMTPIPPEAVLFLIQSGWPVDLIFPVTVASINGLRSGFAAGSNQHPGDSGYFRVVELLRKIQKSGAVGMQIERDNDKQDHIFMIFHRDMLTPDIEEAWEEACKILGLQPGLMKTEITYGFISRNNSEFAMITRSMLHVMIKLATLVDVPPGDVVEGHTVPSLPPPGSGKERLGQVIKISNSTHKPKNAFTAVKYRDHWFWIDDRDFKSKRTFAFLMILFSLTEIGEKGGLPLITIPFSSTEAGEKEDLPQENGSIIIRLTFTPK